MASLLGSQFPGKFSVNLFFQLVLAGATLVATAIPCFAVGLELKLIAPAVLREQLRAGEVSADRRQNAVEQLFREAGCQVRLQPIDKRSSNVICDLSGETSATIMVGAHFDFAERGRGIVDDWSGVSVLVSLYQTLKTEHLKHSYRFVAFGGEERGLFGSSRYVKELSEEQRAGTQAFINLECLGLAAPKVWTNRSAPALVERLREVAAATRISLQGVDVDKVGDDDTHPFLSKNIPVICIHSLTQETWGILHSVRDNMSAIHPDDYFDAYKLVAFYLKYLDTKLPS